MTGGYMMRNTMIWFMFVVLMIGNILPPNMNHSQTTEVTDSVVADNVLSNHESQKGGVYDPSKIEYVREEHSLRSADMKTFVMSDGSYQTAIYPDIVHYETQEGDWLQVDNSLIENKETLNNKSNMYNITFPKDLRESNAIKLSMGSHDISWSVARIGSSRASYSKGLTSSDKIDEVLNTTSQVYYAEVRDHVDLEYVLSGNRVKENIILNAYQERFSMTFQYTFTHLTIEIDKAGHMAFVDEDGTSVMVFDPMFMVDADLNDSQDIEVSHTQITDTVHEIVITPDDQWLKDATYPVVIDPSITVMQDSNHIDDTFIYSGTPSTNYGSYPYFTSGVPTYPYERRALLKFDMPSNLITEHVTHASMTLYRNSITPGQLVNVFKNTSDFIENTVTWNDRPTFDPVVEDYRIMESVDGFTFDITGAVKHWQSHPNYGFTIQNNNAIGGINSFLSSEDSSLTTPMIRINYIPNEGLIKDWTYDTQPLGVAGTGYVADNSGSYVNQRTDFAFSNESTSLNLFFTYSLGERHTVSPYGRGWKSNYEIILHEQDPDQFHIRSGDWGRTDFVFKSSSQKRITFWTSRYTDTYQSTKGDGLSLHIIEEGNLFGKHLTDKYLTDRYGREYHFNLVSNMLDFIITPDGKTLDIVYLADTKIYKIIDDYGNYIRYQYSGNVLTTTFLYLYDYETQSSVCVEKNVYFYTAGMLTGVKKYAYFDDIPSNKDTVSYAYDDDHKMTFFENEVTKDRVDYTYTQGVFIESIYVGQSVSGYTVSRDNQSIGGMTFDYQTNTTTISDHKGHSIRKVFDTYGHTVGVHDDEGHAILSRYLNNYVDENGDPLPHEDINYDMSNKMLFMSDVIKTQVQYLENGQFDNAAYVDLDAYGGWFKSDTTAQGFSFANSAYDIVSHQSASLNQKVNIDKGVYTLSGLIRNDYPSSGMSGANLQVLVGGDTSTSNHVFNTDGVFRKVSVTFTVTEDNTDVIVKLFNQTLGGGYASFDHLVITAGSSKYSDNLVKNSSFETSLDHWTYTSGYRVANNNDHMGHQLGDKAIRLSNSPTSPRSLTQYVMHEMHPGDVMTFGAWVKNYVSEHNELNTLGVSIKFRYLLPGGSAAYTEPYVINGHGKMTGWQQMIMDTTVPDDALVYEGFEISVVYQGKNQVYVDGVQAYLKRAYSWYGYRNDGQITEIDHHTGETTSISYDDNGFISHIESTENGTPDVHLNDLGMIDYLEDLNHHMSVSFQYDLNGTLTSTTVGSLNTGEYYRTSNTYSHTGQYISSHTDPYGNTVYYDFSGLTGLLDEMELPNGSTQYYEYNGFGRLTKTFINGSLGLAEYEYSQSDQLDKVTVGDTSYTISYNTQGLVESVSVDGIATLIENEYAEDIIGGITYQTSILTQKTYATGHRMIFGYNADQQLISVTFDEDQIDDGETPRFEYGYDAWGRIAFYQDHLNDNTWYYTYTEDNQISTITDQYGNIIGYGYDEDGLLVAYDGVRIV